MKDVFLKPGKERSLLRRHPWVFSGAVGRAEAANDGETVRILDSRGEFLALGCRSNSSAIALRVWSDRKSTRLNSSHKHRSRMPSSA